MIFELGSFGVGFSTLRQGLVLTLPDITLSNKSREKRSVGSLCQCRSGRHLSEVKEIVTRSYQQLLIDHLVKLCTRPLSLKKYEDVVLLRC